MSLQECTKVQHRYDTETPRMGRKVRSRGFHLSAGVPAGSGTEVLSIFWWCWQVRSRMGRISRSWPGERDLQYMDIPEHECGACVPAWPDEDLP